MTLAVFAGSDTADWLLGIALGMGNFLGAAVGVRVAILRGHRWLEGFVTATIIVFAIVLWFTATVKLVVDQTRDLPVLELVGPFAIEQSTPFGPVAAGRFLSSLIRNGWPRPLSVVACGRGFCFSKIAI